MTEHAYSKTTFHKNVPEYSIPIAGANNLDAILNQVSPKKKKHASKEKKTKNFD
jgi:hypothetical protein